MLAPPARPGVRRHQRLAMTAASFPVLRHMGFFFKPLFQAMPHGVETDINRRLFDTPSVARWRAACAVIRNEGGEP